MSQNRFLIEIDHPRLPRDHPACENSCCCDDCYPCSDQDIARAIRQKKGNKTDI